MYVIKLAILGRRGLQVERGEAISIIAKTSEGSRRRLSKVRLHPRALNPENPL
jgi:hypothetical protein